MKIITGGVFWVKTKIITRLLAWLEALGQLWTSYWLLFISVLLVCASIPLRWINFPLSKSFSAAQIPLLTTIGLTPHRHLLSYGIFAFAVLAVGLLARFFSRWPLLFASVALFTIFLSFPCQIAFEQPAVLHRLDAEISDVSLTRNFTKNYSPENFGYVEDLPSHLELGTGWGRLVAGISFLGLGWVALGVGSILLISYATSNFPGRSRLLTAACFCVPVAAVGILTCRPFIAQHYFIGARIDQAQGHNEQAILKYRRAMWWDRWFEEDILTYAMIGDLQRQLNFAEGSPERHVKQGQIYKQAGQYEQAIFEFGQAATAGGPVAVAARRESARTRLEFGLALYRAGAVGAAVTNWERAVAEDPAQIQGFVYLARGDYDIARYQLALDAANEVIKATGLNSVQADALSLGGDCYTKLGQDEDARRYYTRSIKLDNEVNHWAASGLVGR